MADRKPTATKNTRPSTAAKRPAGARAADRPGAGKPRKASTSIVNQRQTPWGVIVASVLVVLFGAGVITYVATRHSSSEPSASTSNDPYRQPALSDAMKISGVTYKMEPDHNHVSGGTVKYDATPPVGGNHSPVWADCTGTVYPNAIANENAVHALEHGAVWIAYRPGLAAGQLATLTKLVDGQDRMLMSPYPGLDTAVSVQAWGYQLKVDNASDPRITQFIDTLRYNPKTTPEYGAQCADAPFKAKPSTFGNPVYSLS